MGSKLSNPVVFFISSLVTLIILYYQVPVKTLQQIILVIVIVLAIFLNRFLLSPKDSLLGRVTRALFLFLTALMIQLLVLSSGGFKSPFLILIHIYTLGTSFLVSLVASISFLLFSILALIAQIVFDENISRFFYEDIGTILLYGASFLVIIPISVFVSRAYTLKDRLFEIVKKELKLKQIQHQTLLKGISDIIFVVDKNLNIISTNEAAEIELSLPQSAIIQRPLFDVLFIRDGSGKLVNVQALSIDRVVEEKTTRIIKELKLLAKNRAAPRLVDVQIRSIVNLEGQVDQLMVIISDTTKNIKNIESLHPILEQARLRQNALAENLKKLLILKGSPELKVRTDLAWKASQDIAILSEIEDHSIQAKPTLVDVADICLRNVSSQQDFAKSLGVSLGFQLVNFGTKDINPIVPAGSQISPHLLTAPYFTCPVDMKWFDTLIHKLLDIAILLVAGMPNPKIWLTVEREEQKALIIKITTSLTFVRKGEEMLLFKEYYGDLSNRTNLRFGSGLEGFLSKSIASLLNIPINIDTQNGQVILQLKISRGPG